MKNFISTLAQRQGTYQGSGLNHEGQAFTGKLLIEPVVQGSGIAISFIATGHDGTIFHEEQSLIALNVNESLCLWNLNNNTPGLVEHNFRREEKLDGADQSFIFGFGDVANTASFREEIGIDLWANGDITYRYNWGMPGGEFAPRSAVRMSRVVDASKTQNQINRGL